MLHKQEKQIVWTLMSDSMLSGTPASPAPCLSVPVCPAIPSRCFRQQRLLKASAAIIGSARRFPRKKPLMPSVGVY